VIADVCAMAMPEPQLHLLSWNVAGWKKTCEQIRKFEGGLPSFFEKHHIDVLCLQETKLTAKALEQETKALGADLAGYETFWACNEGAGAQRQGLNGVATIARSGSVLRADGAPLGDPQLDAEGRCLMTDHGDFVIFNVYVPNAAGGARLPYKLRWLKALRSAMQRVRTEGRPVMLVGDLNMKNRAADVYWSCRMISQRALMDLASKDIDSEAKEVVSAACSFWPALKEALRGKEHHQFETKNGRTGQTFQRWGVFVETSSGNKVRLGTPEDSEQSARGSFLMEGIGCQDDGEKIFGPGSQGASYVLKSPDSLHLCDLVESLKRICGVDVKDSVQKYIANNIGQDPTAPSVQAWLQSVLCDDSMVDSFAELHPNAQERFTCWDQYKNNRHINAGSRIDYILVDRIFFEKYVRRGAELYTGRAVGQLESDSEEAARYAAVLGGQSMPSPFEGTGMPTLEEDEYYAQFRPSASSGIVYTPPQLSDHVATSLLLQGIKAQQSNVKAASTKDAATRRCQPHCAARRITDFFGKKREISVAGPTAAAIGKRPALGAA
jgi:exodeoxyribonuclease III